MEIYKDPSKPISERVEDLLSRMTLEEKVAQLCGDLPASFLTDGKVDRKLLREKFPDGHGRFTQFSIVGLIDPEQIASVSNEIQRYFVEETRLGIPVAIQTENLCGYPAAGGTLFPSMLNLGCTWEPELAEEMSSIIGQESRSVGISSAMSPVLDVSWDPRWGRTYETFGEDPYLISQFGIHYVRGMQNQGVSCIAKHFLGYAATQGGLNTSAFRMGKREMYEIFATPFEAADKLADLDAVMANYGEIDGLPVIDNPEIIGSLLRDTMGFRGAVTSDGAAILKTYNFFKVAKTYEEAGLLAKRAGTDTEIPVGDAFRQLPKYVRNGNLEESCINESVRRILSIKFKCGLFENPYCDVSQVKQALGGESKSNLSRKIAEKSIILLENNGILPLAKGKKLAVVGPHANSLRYGVSGYTYPAYVEMMKAGASGKNVSFNGLADEQQKADQNAKEKKPMGPFMAMFAMFSEEDRAKMSDMNQVLRNMGARSLQETLADTFHVRYAQGCDIIGKETDGFEAAIAAAQDSDIVIYACGGNSGWVNVTGGEGKDRQHLDLPGVQQQLLEQLVATGKPVVLVLYGPGIFKLNWAAEHCAAIVQAFMPGQFAASAISDVLTGKVNPGGKLVFSIPRSEGQLPVVYNHRVGSGYHSGADLGAGSSIFSGGYVDGPADPLYPFGHGLSYTQFSLENLRISSPEVPTDGTVEIQCAVHNTGRVSGDEVVQLYTSFTDAHVTRPNKQLTGFLRVSLQAGEKKDVSFCLNIAQLGYYNEFMEFVVEPGTLNIMIGNSAENLPLRAAIALTGKATNVMGKRSYVCPAKII